MGPKMEPQNLQNRGPNPPKSSPNGPREVQDDQTKKKNRNNTWLQVGFQNRPKIDQKSMPKSIKNLMHLGIDFWEDLGGFGEPKWSHVTTQVEQISMPNAKNDFLKNRALAAAGA